MYFMANLGHTDIKDSNMVNVTIIMSNIWSWLVIPEPTTKQSFSDLLTRLIMEKVKHEINCNSVFITMLPLQSAPANADISITL